MTTAGDAPHDHRDDHARRDGQRRDVRPHRRRLRPLLGRSRVARAALREDALRPGPARARLPPRAASCSASAAGARSSSETIGYVLARAAPPRRRLLLGRGRRLARRATATAHEGLFHTWTPDEVARRARRRRASRRRSSGTASPTDGQLRGPHRSRTGSTHRGELARPPAIEAARQRLFAARDQPPAARPRRQGAHRVERADPVVARRGGGRARPRGLARRGRRQRRVPGRATCARPNGRWQRSWQADGEPQARHAALAADHAALVDAFTRLAEATGRGPLDRRGAWQSPTRCSTTSGTRTTAASSRPPTTPRRWSSARRTCSTTPRRRPTRSPPWRSYRLAALTGERASPTTPTASCSSSTAIARRHRRRLLQRPRSPSTCGGAASPRSPSSATAPTWCASPHTIWRPDTVLAWGEPYDSPLWDGRRDGFAYVCRELRLRGAAGHRRGLHRGAHGSTGRHPWSSDRLGAAAPPAPAMNDLGRRAGGGGPALRPGSVSSADLGGAGMADRHRTEQLQARWDPERAAGAPVHRGTHRRTARRDRGPRRPAAASSPTSTCRSSSTAPARRRRSRRARSAPCRARA